MLSKLLQVFHLSYPSLLSTNPSLAVGQSDLMQKSIGANHPQLGLLWASTILLDLDPFGAVKLNVSAGDRWVFTRDFFPFLMDQLQKSLRQCPENWHMAIRPAQKTKRSSSKFQHDGIVSSTVISCCEKKWTTFDTTASFQSGHPQKKTKSSNPN